MTTSSMTNTSVLAEFTSGAQSDIAMMIGVGIVKDSDAVFFQYNGNEVQPTALMLPTSGKPLTNLVNVRLTGISIAEDIGEFKSTKLNLFLESTAGNTVMVTSGLTTIWSQCIITSLMGLFNSYSLDQPFSLSSWKGTSKMRPCFAAIYQSNAKVSDQMMYDQLRELRADRATDKLNATLRDAVEILNNAVTGGAVAPVEVAVEPAQLTDHPDF